MGLPSYKVTMETPKGSIVGRPPKKKIAETAKVLEQAGFQMSDHPDLAACGAWAFETRGFHFSKRSIQIGDLTTKLCILCDSNREWKAGGGGRTGQPRRHLCELRGLEPHVRVAPALARLILADPHGGHRVGAELGEELPDVEGLCGQPPPPPPYHQLDEHGNTKVARLP